MPGSASCVSVAHTRTLDAAVRSKMERTNVLETMVVYVLDWTAR